MRRAWMTTDVQVLDDMTDVMRQTELKVIGFVPAATAPLVDALVEGEALPDACDCGPSGPWPHVSITIMTTLVDRKRRFWIIAVDVHDRAAPPAPLDIR